MTQNLEADSGTDGDSRALIRRVNVNAFWAWIVFIPWSLYIDGWRGLLGLTCSALVVMINFLWLEHVVVGTLQPSPHVDPRSLVRRTLLRFVLFGLALAISLLVVRFNALSVLLGFSTLVAGIMGEAVRALYLSLKNSSVG